MARLDVREGRRSPARRSRRGRRSTVGCAWLSLARAYRRAAPHDLVLVGYFGHLDVHLARLLAGRERVVLDMYLSVYDTVVNDRRLVPPDSVRARLARLVDRRAAAASRLALLDTPEHVDYLADEVGIARERLADVPIGAEPDARPYRATEPGERLQVLFFGNFVPLQGTRTIAAAIRLLRDAPIDFTIAGRGVDHPAFEAALGDAPSVRDVEWIEPERLVRGDRRPRRRARRLRHLGQGRARRARTRPTRRRPSAARS